MRFRPARFRLSSIPALLLLAAGIGLVVTGFQRANQRWTVVKTQALPVHEGQSIRIPFTADLPAKYEIVLSCDRDFPQKQWRSLVEPGPPFRCEVEPVGEASPANISRFFVPLWTGTDFLTQRLASFEGVPGQNYILDLMPARPLPELRDVQPTLRISVNSGTYKNAFGMGGIQSWTGIFLGVAGLVWLRARPVFQAENPLPAKTSHGSVSPSCGKA